MQEGDSKEKGTRKSELETMQDVSNRLEILVDKAEESNPGSSELIISELRRVGEQIVGAINLLDQSVKQVATAVRDNNTRTEDVQNTLNRLRWAVWPSVVGIAGAILSIWLTRKPPTP